MTLYAVNLSDIVCLQKTNPVAALLFPPEILGETVSTGHRIDDFAQVLICEDERILAIARIMLQMYPRSCPVRIYEKKGGWRYIHVAAGREDC